MKIKDNLPLVFFFFLTIMLFSHENVISALNIFVFA